MKFGIKSTPKSTIMIARGAAHFVAEIADFTEVDQFTNEIDFLCRRFTLVLAK